MNGYGPLTRDRLGQLAEDGRKDLDFDALPVGTIVKVKTANSEYLLRRDGGGTSVKGTERFPDWTRVCFNGSTWGGSMIRIGHIGYGMHMEIGRFDAATLTTSPVECWEILP